MDCATLSRCYYFCWDVSDVNRAIASQCVFGQETATDKKTEEGASRLKAKSAMHDKLEELKRRHAALHQATGGSTA